MAIVLPQRTVGPFGGPGGATQDSIAMLMQGIMQGMEKRKQEQQNQELSNMFAGFNEQRPNFVGPPSPENQGQQPMSSMDFVNRILSNPKLDSRSKSMAINAIQAGSGMDLQEAQAEYYRRKQEGPQEKYVMIEYWKPDGSPGGKVMTSEKNYNRTVEQLQKAGNVVNKVEQDNGKTGEFERLLNKLDKDKRLTPEKKNDLIIKRINKLVETGGDKDMTNKVQLGDDSTVTLAELRNQYLVRHGIKDEFSLMMMESSDDPMLRKRAEDIRKDMQVNFPQFLRDAKKNGLEGVSPIYPNPEHKQLSREQAVQYKRDAYQELLKQGEAGKITDEMVTQRAKEKASKDGFEF